MPEAFFLFNGLPILSYPMLTLPPDQIQSQTPDANQCMHAYIKVLIHPTSTNNNKTKEIIYKPHPVHIHSPSPLKILIKSEIPPILMLLLLHSLLFPLRTSHHARLLIITHSFLKEVGFAC